MEGTAILVNYFPNNQIPKQESLWKMALNNFDTKIMKVVQATHNRGDVRCGMSRDIQCSCMSLMSVSWTLFKSASIWDSFGLDCLLQKGDVLLKSLSKYRYLGMKDLPQGFCIENSSINVEFINNRTEEITAGAYLLSRELSRSSVDYKQLHFRFTLGKPVFFSVWLNSKDGIGRMSVTCTTVFLKFDSLQALENYMKSVYYSNYPMTLYFQLQFLKLKCTENTKSTIKSASKSERKKKKVR